MIWPHQAWMFLPAVDQWFSHPGKPVNWVLPEAAELTNAEGAPQSSCCPGSTWTEQVLLNCPCLPPAHFMALSHIQTNWVFVFYNNIIILFLIIIIFTFIIMIFSDDKITHIFIWEKLENTNALSHKINESHWPSHQAGITLCNILVYFFPLFFHDIWTHISPCNIKIIYNTVIFVNNLVEALRKIIHKIKLLLL